MHDDDEVVGGGDETLAVDERTRGKPSETQHVHGNHTRAVAHHGSVARHRPARRARVGHPSLPAERVLRGRVLPQMRQSGRQEIRAPAKFLQKRLRVEVLARESTHASRFPRRVAEAGGGDGAPRAEHGGGEVFVFVQIMRTRRRRETLTGL